MKSKPELAILVPVLRRPHRVEPLLRSIAHSTPNARVIFLASENDRHEIRAIRQSRRLHPDLPVDLEVCGGGYAFKINQGIELTDEPLLFIGADDLEFRSGWLELARAHLSDEIGVVGMNDGLRRRREHATHFLVTRAYAEQKQLDGSPGLLHEGYNHSFVDDELIATALIRGAYAYAKDAVVDHLHWMNGRAEDDAIYRRGRRHFDRDRALFTAREAVAWT